ncbi:hypothetical protein GQ600_11794 [Phytophthora cactorum]|nr:hypothetical protein GQ600_11794 [Phytophthora cactorum]
MHPPWHFDSVHRISLRYPSEGKSPFGSFDDKSRSPLYDANHIETVTGLVRNGQTYFDKLYALQRLKWSVISDAKMSQIDFNIHRGCVKEAPERDLVLVASALQTGTDEEKEEAALRCACIASSASSDKLQEDGIKAHSTGSSGEINVWLGTIQPLITLLRSGNNDMQKL